MGGFWVLEIRCDYLVRAAMDLIVALQSPHIHMNYSNIEAERNNRVIQELVHTCYNRLFYLHLK